MKWDSLLTAGQAFAQGAAPAQPNMVEVLAMPLGLLVIMYFFMIRPQARKNKDRLALIAGLKSGDEVLTTSGIIGRVKAVADAFITVEIAPNTAVKFSKSSIDSLTKPPATAAAVTKK